MISLKKYLQAFFGYKHINKLLKIVENTLIEILKHNLENS
ncbi:MAG: hypothetical protein H6Q20_1153 [Bacteroidetes bacterium]|nr:hypothetical protein [Bacteroidota bacterium]